MRRTLSKDSLTQDLHVFQEITDSVPAMVAVYTITGKYIYVNKSAKKLLGYSAEDFITGGTTFLISLIHPDDLPHITKQYIDALAAANKKNHSSDNDPIITYEYRMKHKDGRWRWLHTDGSVFSRDTSGQVIYLLNASLDITLRKEAEEKYKTLTANLEKRIIERTKELEASENRYKTFLSQSSEGIWRFEVDKPISVKLPVKKQLEECFTYAYLAECNDALAKMYGFVHASDLIGARLPDLLIPIDEGNIQFLTNFVTSGYRLTNAESREKDKDGNDRFFQNSLIGIIENGYLVRAWGTQRDITEMKKLEQRKDDFIALASHELKTPLTSLKIFTQVLPQYLQKQGDKTIVKHLATMDKQISKLTELVNGLLDVARVQSGKLTYKKEKFVMKRLVKEVIEHIQRITTTHAIIFEGTPVQKVLADRERIGQVLTNLINNAVKYSPVGTEIIISMKETAGSLLVSVQDFGIGIPDKEREKIFERFFQASDPVKQTYPGLGLGLHISKEIIERHQGKIWVESNGGKGSIFYFTLPLVK
jgi:PAS domain S-box-containing protein